MHCINYKLLQVFVAHITTMNDFKADSNTQQTVTRAVFLVLWHNNLGLFTTFPLFPGQMLDKLRERWSNTGLWEKLEQQKTVITEPRGGGKGDFNELLQTYYEAIKGCQERGGARSARRPRALETIGGESHVRRAILSVQAALC